MWLPTPHKGDMPAADASTWGCGAVWTGSSREVARAANMTTDGCPGVTLANHSDFVRCQMFRSKPSDLNAVWRAQSPGNNPAAPRPSAMS